MIQYINKFYIMEELPCDILFHILNYLSLQDTIHFVSTNRYMKGLLFKMSNMRWYKYISDLYENKEIQYTYFNQDNIEYRNINIYYKDENYLEQYINMTKLFTDKNTPELCSINYKILSTIMYNNKYTTVFKNVLISCNINSILRPFESQLICIINDTKLGKLVLEKSKEKYGDGYYFEVCEPIIIHSVVRRKEHLLKMFSKEQLEKFRTSLSTYHNSKFLQRVISSM